MATKQIGDDNIVHVRPAVLSQTRASVAILVCRAFAEGAYFNLAEWDELDTFVRENLVDLPIESEN